MLQEARTQRDAQVDMAVPETPLPTEYCGSALGAQNRKRPHKTDVLNDILGNRAFCNAQRQAGLESWEALSEEERTKGDESRSVTGALSGEGTAFGKETHRFGRRE